MFQTTRRVFPVNCMSVRDGRVKWCDRGCSSQHLNFHHDTSSFKANVLQRVCVSQYSMYVKLSIINDILLSPGKQRLLLKSLRFQSAQWDFIVQSIHRYISWGTHQLGCQVAHMDQRDMKWHVFPQVNIQLLFCYIAIWEIVTMHLRMCSSSDMTVDIIPQVDLI